ncbi:hypothetical protein SAMN05444162_2148 [Paenibacillaceae bacterium GAS479]|nr:hypothetical protein SAMN05444162_2148 [Paenibacillaceae bacterium GAS479]
MHVQLINAAGGLKEVKLGFSWTTFFFGFFPALFRGDLKWAAIMFVAGLAAGLFTWGIGLWVPGLIFSFIYNQMYIKELLEKGYYPINEHVEHQMRARGIIA